MINFTIHNPDNNTYIKTLVDENLTLEYIKKIFMNRYNINHNNICIYTWIKKNEEYIHIEDENMSAKNIITNFSDNIYMGLFWPEDPKEKNITIIICNVNDNIYFNYTINEKTTVKDIKNIFCKTIYRTYDINELDVYVINPNISLVDNDKTLFDYNVAHNSTIINIGTL